MYRRNNIESKREMYPSLINLNTKYFQEMYLDTSSLSSSSISPTISSAPASPLRQGASCSLTPTSTTSGTSTYNEYQYGLAIDDSVNSGFTSASSLSMSSMVGPEITANNSHNHSWALQYNDYLQQQYILNYQQQLAASAAVFTRPELTCGTIAAGDNSSQSQDEISKSLKMFAMLTSRKTDRPQSAQSPVDVIMQDFACNGNICDELKFNQQQYQAAMNFANIHHNFTSNSCHNNIGNITPNNTAAANAVTNNQDVRKHLWMMLPAQMQHSSGTVTSAAAAAANIDYNNNSYNTNKKPQKRYSNYKNDKFSAKHCVFCENNKEPEAVVKSHAVRDSLGRVLCPKLRTYICPICKASGDMAHTVKYCPQKPIITMEDAIKAETFRLNNKGHYYKQQMKV